MRDLARPAGSIQVSNQGGAEPRWTRDGKKLYFSNANRLLEVDLRFEPRLELSAPRVLPDVRLAVRSALVTYVLGTGGRFLGLLPDAGSDRTEIVVVPDWAAEVRRSRPGGSGR